jgi:hypothetical protein
MKNCSVHLCVNKGLCAKTQTLYRFRLHLHSPSEGANHWCSKNIRMARSVCVVPGQPDADRTHSSGVKWLRLRPLLCGVAWTHRPLGDEAPARPQRQSTVLQKRKSYETVYMLHSLLHIKIWALHFRPSL